MTTYIHDGVEFDLTRTFADVTGVEWRWSGERTPDGEPLLIGTGDRSPKPLPDVYHDHGPLIPLPQLRKAVLSADFVRSVADGFVETYEQYARRTAQATR